MQEKKGVVTKKGHARKGVVTKKGHARKKKAVPTYFGTAFAFKQVTLQLTGPEEA